MSHRPYSIGIPEQDPTVTTDDHAALQNVTANQHHAKSHTHDGSDGSGVVSYDSLTDQPTEVVEHSNVSHVTTGFPGTSAPGDGTQQGSSTSVARLDHQHAREDTIGSFGTRDHDLLTGLTDDDHTQYVLHTDVDDTPVDGVTDDPISSNWAFDHVAAADPHTGYRLESADHTHATSGLQAGTVAHSALTGLTSGDDHTQYRLESADHSHVSTGLQAGQLDHGAALTGLTDDDHTQYALNAGRVSNKMTSGIVPLARLYAVAHQSLARDTTAWTTSIVTYQTFASISVTAGDIIEIFYDFYYTAATSSTEAVVYVEQSAGTAVLKKASKSGETLSVGSSYVIQLQAVTANGQVRAGMASLRLYVTGTGTATMLLLAASSGADATNAALCSSMQVLIEE